MQPRRVFLLYKTSYMCCLGPAPTSCYYHAMNCSWLFSEQMLQLPTYQSASWPDIACFNNQPMHWLDIVRPPSWLELGIICTRLPWESPHHMWHGRVYRKLDIKKLFHYVWIITGMYLISYQLFVQKFLDAYAWSRNANITFSPIFLVRSWIIHIHPYNIFSIILERDR